MLKKLASGVRYSWQLSVESVQFVHATKKITLTSKYCVRWKVADRANISGETVSKIPDIQGDNEIAYNESFPIMAKLKVGKNGWKPKNLNVRLLKKKSASESTSTGDLTINLADYNKVKFTKSNCPTQKKVFGLRNSDMTVTLTFKIQVVDVDMGMKFFDMNTFNSLGEQYSNANLVIKSNKEQIERLLKETEVNKQKLSDVESKKSELRTELQQKSKDITTLNDSVTSLNDSVSGLTIEATKSKELQTNLQKEADSLHSQLQAKTEQCETLEITLSGKASLFEDTFAKLSAALSKIDSNTNIIDSQAKKIDDQAAEIISQAKEINTQTAEIASQAKEIDTQAAEIASQATKIELQTVEIASQKKKIESQSMEITSQQKKIESQTMASKSMTTSEPKEKEEESTKNQQRVQAEAVKSLKTTITSLEATNKELKNRLNAVDTPIDIRSQLGQANAQKDDLQEKLDKMKIIFEKLQATKEEANNTKSSKTTTEPDYKYLAIATTVGIMTGFVVKSVLMKFSKSN